MSVATEVSVQIYNLMPSYDMLSINSIAMLPVDANLQRLGVRDTPVVAGGTGMCHLVFLLPPVIVLLLQHYRCSHTALLGACDEADERAVGHDLLFTSYPP